MQNPEVLPSPDLYYEREPLPPSRLYPHLGRAAIILANRKDRFKIDLRAIQIITLLSGLKINQLHREGIRNIDNSYDLANERLVALGRDISTRFDSLEARADFALNRLS